MKALLTKIFGPSWETSLAGFGTLICGGTALSGVLPDKYNTTLSAVCTILIAYGFIRSKDGNVTNSKAPEKAAAVVELPSGTIVKNAVVSCLALLTLTGCASFMNTNTGAVLLKVHQDAQSVLVAGCQGMPARHVLIGTVLPFIPPQYGLPAQGALAIETVAATALCAQVQATPELVKPFVPSAPAVNSAMPVDTTPPVLIGPKP